MKTSILTLLFLLSISIGYSQNYGEIHGRVIDYTTGDPILYATVSTEYGGKLIGTITDEEGKFRLKPLQPGKYALVVSYLGYKPRTLGDLEVTSGKINVQEILKSQPIMSSRSL